MGSKSFSNLFNYKNELTDYELRDVSNSLCLLQLCSNSMKKSFMYDGATLWNSLPKEFRDIKALRSFETKISCQADFHGGRVQISYNNYL